MYFDFTMFFIFIFLFFSVLMGLSLSVNCLLTLISLVLSILGSDVSSTHHHDYCVLGAGPAGLQMGYFLSKSQRDYIILERNSEAGSFFQK